MKTKKSLTLKIVLTLLILVLLGSLYYYKDYIFGTVASGNGVCYTACQNKTNITDKGIADAVEKTYDGVVVVENYTKDKLVSSGTGFVYKIDKTYGYILTNYHVINGNTSLKVIESDETTIDATFVGGDEFLDIAVLKIPKDKVKKVIEIGSSSNSRLGDTVFTIGTPVDYQYMGTVTRGILSGKDRLVSVSLSGVSEDYVMKVLQTDAAMNPGNSGGPLLNVNGEVIGINSLKIAEQEVEGMGFAIPIEDVMENIKTLEKGEKIIRPFLGISMANANDEYALKAENVSYDSTKKGVIVISVVEKSPVDKILQKGDNIIKLDDVEIKSLAYLRYELYKHQVGDTVKITFIRDGKTITKDIVLSQESN